jgi:iron complex outermembrane receptor protein
MAAENTKNVTTYGVEAGFIFDKKIGNQYIYAMQIMLIQFLKDATGLQLIYVPYHKLSSSVSYSYKQFLVFLSVYLMEKYLPQAIIFIR